MKTKNKQLGIIALLIVVLAGSAYEVHSPWLKSGTDVWVANVADQVGIGKTAPSQELDVSGDIVASGDATADNFIIGVSGGYTGIGGATWVYDDVSNDTTTVGNVGIGTTAPDRKLHIMQSDAALSPADSSSILIIEENDTTGLEIMTPANKDGQVVFSDGASDGWLVYDHNIRKMRFGAAGSNQMYISTTGVGIGSDATPDTQLEIYDSTAHPIVTISGAHATDYDPQIKFSTDSTPIVKFSLGVDGNDDKLKIFSGDGVGDSTEFVIDTSGNVGMGTATPGAKLDVTGDTQPQMQLNGYNISRVFWDTTDDTARNALTIAVSENQVCSIEAIITVEGQDTTHDVGRFHCEGVFYRDTGGNVTVEGTVDQLTKTPAGSSLDGDITHDTTNVIIQITGDATTDMQWRIYTEYELF